MYNRSPRVLTTMEEDFRAIGLLPPEKKLQEVDDSSEPRDIPSPDPSTDTGSDMQAMPARHKYAKQPKPKMAPDEKDDHDDPLDAGATQKKGGSGSYKRVAGGKESTLEAVDTPLEGYTLLKNKVMARAKDKGKAPAVAHGLAPVKDNGLKYPKKMESANVSKAAELVGEIDALVRGSQMGEDVNNLVHGFTLIGENCSLLAQRLVDIAEHYEVDGAIEAMESLYNSAAEACEIIESAGSAEDTDEELDLDGLKEAFRVMTLQLMDAVEAYDVTLAEASDKDDDDDKKDDDDDDDSDDDDDDDDKDDDGGMAARMAKLKAMKGKKGPFGK